MLNAFRLTAILISGVLWGAWLVLVLRKKDVHPLRDALGVFSRLGWMKKVGVLFVVVQLTMFGGAKHGGTNDVDDVTSTNDVALVDGGDANEIGDIVLNALQPMTNGAALPGGCGPLGTTAPAVTVRRYRLESVSTNSDISYEMPAEGTVRGTWHLTGAYEAVHKVSLVPHPSSPIPHPFSFPLGSDLCTSLWAYTWGKVRPQLKNASNEIVAAGAPMSAIPRVSRFWTAATSNDTYLLTWENFAAGRMTASLGEDAEGAINAQIELFRSGDFITRSNDVESVWRRVIEPNPIDPVNPPDPADPTKSLHPYGPVQDLSVVGETNAYCWVDIVVNAADAWVRFEGDGASNLADPSFAAKAGETNRVVILIGKTYKVTCDMPFAVVGKSDPAIDEWWEDGNTLCLKWPVDIWAVGDDEEPLLLLTSFGLGSHRGNGFTMFVTPSGLGGGFDWTSSCCSVSGSGCYFSCTCIGNCGCGGCTLAGYYAYEGYRLPAWGGRCGCSYADDPDTPPPAGISVCFTKTAVIFEDAYQASPNTTVRLRSTSTELCCSVYGGERGGFVLITATGIDDRLDCIGGSQTFPVYRQLEPQETFAFTNSYKAIAQSGSANDIVVTGTFIENDTGETFDAEDRATAIRVKFEPVLEAPENKSSGRHKYGVYEEVNCSQSPSAPQLSWNLTAGTMSSNNTKYRCPLIAAGNPIRVSCGGAEFTPIISVVEPSRVVVRGPAYNDFDAPLGEAGSIVMLLPLYIGPFDVNFTQIAVEEVPDSTGIGTGYFGRKDMATWTSHTVANGAGIWRDVTAENKMGDLLVYDQAGVTETLSRMNSYGLFVDDPTCGWQHGTIDMPNPFGWNITGTRSGPPVGRFAEGTHDVIELEEYGKCSVQKLQNEVYRLTNGCVYLNGVLQP